MSSKGVFATFVARALYISKIRHTDFITFEGDEEVCFFVDTKEMRRYDLQPMVSIKRKEPYYQLRWEIPFDGVEIEEAELPLPRGIRYIYDENIERFVILSNIEMGCSHIELGSALKALSDFIDCNIWRFYIAIKS